MEEKGYDKITRMAELVIRDRLNGFGGEGPLTKQEKAELDAWLSEGDHFQVCQAFIEDAVRGILEKRFDTDAALQSVNRRLGFGGNSRIRKLHTPTWVSAAAIGLVAVTVLLLWLRRDRPATMMAKPIAAVTPATGKAYLVDEAGERIPLREQHDTVFSAGGATFVQKGRALTLGNTGGAVSYHKLVTPSGGTYRLRLPDGSEAELNAASSIRFPSAFHGERREIEIDGEVFLTVAKDEHHPFFVKLGREVRVEVLGTAFNVRTYEKEKTEVVLFNGAIRLEATGISSAMVNPGEMAELGSGKLATTEVDTLRAAAWRNGLFDAHDVTVEELMDEISRWYDVDFSYAEGFGKRARIYGEFPRSLALDKLLDLLTKARVASFEMIGNKRIKVTSADQPK